MNQVAKEANSAIQDALSTGEVTSTQEIQTYAASLNVVTKGTNTLSGESLVCKISFIFSFSLKSLLIN